MANLREIQKRLVQAQMLLDQSMADINELSGVVIETEDRKVVTRELNGKPTRSYRRRHNHGGVELTPEARIAFRNELMQLQGQYKSRSKLARLVGTSDSNIYRWQKGISVPFSELADKVHAAYLKVFSVH